MPTKDREKSRDQARARQARFKAKRGNALPVTPAKVTPSGQSPVTPWTGKQAMVGGELVPVRCWHCGAYHATVQLARDCKLETAEGARCATYGRGRAVKRALPDVAAIAKSLSAGKLGHRVRFGCYGPTFEEIARELARD